MQFETLKDFNRVWKPKLSGKVLSVGAVYYKNGNETKIPLDHIYCVAIDTEVGMLLLPTRNTRIEVGKSIQVTLGCEFADVGLYTVLNSEEHKLEGWGEGTAYLEVNS